MKKNQFIIPLALTVLLTGCGTGSQESSVSSSSNEVASSSSESSVSPEEVSSSSSVAPVELSLEALDGYAYSFVVTKSAISGGSISKKSEDSYSKDETSSAFVYGKDANGDTLRVTQDDESTYVMKNSSGDILTIKKNNYGDYVEADSYDSYSSIAPYFSGYLESREAYGVEEFLDDIVSAAKENPNKDFKGTVDGDDVSFSFSYFLVEDDRVWTYYIVNANFSIAETSLTGLDLTIAQFSGSSNYTYDKSTGLVTLTDTAKASRTDTYAITQTIGERTYTNDVDLSSFEYQSISLLDSEGSKVDDTNGVSMKKGDSVELTISSTPSTANLNFDKPNFVVTSGDETGLTYEFNRSEDGTKETLTIYGDEAGEYEVSVTTAHAATSFKVTVTEIKPTSMAVRLYSYDMNGNYSTGKLSDGDGINATTYITYYLAANVLPNDANKTYLAKVTDTDGNEVDEDSFSIDNDDTLYSGDEDLERKAISFTGFAEGIYNLTIYCAADENIKQTYTVNVINSNFEDLLSGASYGARVNGNGAKKYEFSFITSGEMNGSATIKDVENNTTITSSYEISRVDDEDYYEFNFEETVPFDGLFISEDNRLYINFGDGEGYFPLYLTTSVAYLMPMSWTGSATDDDDYEYTMKKLQFAMDGTVSGKFVDEDDTDYYLNCEYTIDVNSDGSYAITFCDDGFCDDSDNEWFNKLPAKATLSSDMSTLTFTTDGYVDATFVLSAK